MKKETKSTQDWHVPVAPVGSDLSVASGDDPRCLILHIDVVDLYTALSRLRWESSFFFFGKSTSNDEENLETVSDSKDGSEDRFKGSLVECSWPCLVSDSLSLLKKRFNS